MNMSYRVTCVIPARYGSKRLPGKPLLSATGKPLIQHTIEAARRSRLIESVIVTTDHVTIAKAATDIGCSVLMTSLDIPTGLDRVKDVVRTLPIDSDIVVNLQGDEPEISGESLDTLIGLLIKDHAAPMATLSTYMISEYDYWLNPSVVKVIVSETKGRALYFTRTTIPMAYRHLGVYAYRRDFLLALNDLPFSRLEAAENLEQMRVLDAGHPIAITVVNEPGIGVDTEADYVRFVERWRASHPARIGG